MLVGELAPAGLLLNPDGHVGESWKEEAGGGGSRAFFGGKETRVAPLEAQFLAPTWWLTTVGGTKV